MYPTFSAFSQLHITPVALQAMEKASTFLFPLTDTCAPYVYFNPMIVHPTVLLLLSSDVSYLVALLTGPRGISRSFCVSSSILNF